MNAISLAIIVFISVVALLDIRYLLRRRKKCQNNGCAGNCGCCHSPTTCNVK